MKTLKKVLIAIGVIILCLAIAFAGCYFGLPKFKDWADSKIFHKEVSESDDEILKRLDELQNALAEMTKERDDLKVKVDVQVKNYNEIVDKLNKSEAREKELMVQVKEYQDTVVELRTQVETKTQLIVEKEKEVERLIEEKKVVEQRVVELESGNSEEIKELEAQIKQKNAEIDKLKTEKNDLEKSVQSLQARLNSMTEELERLQDENNQLNIQITILNQNIVELNEKIEALDEALLQDVNKQYLNDEDTFTFCKLNENYAVATQETYNKSAGVYYCNYYLVNRYDLSYVDIDPNNQFENCGVVKEIFKLNDDTFLFGARSIYYPIALIFDSSNKVITDSCETSYPYSKGFYLLNNNFVFLNGVGNSHSGLINCETKKFFDPTGITNVDYYHDVFYLSKTSNKDEFLFQQVESEYGFLHCETGVYVFNTRTKTFTLKKQNDLVSQVFLNRRKNGAMGMLEDDGALFVDLQESEHKVLFATGSLEDSSLSGIYCLDTETGEITKLYSKQYGNNILNFTEFEQYVEIEMNTDVLYYDKTSGTIVEEWPAVTG